jgi:ABC-type Fe3+-hydroxamate transport system substrate-binding protein
MRRYALLIILSVLLSACSSNGEDGSSASTNSSAAQTNSNSASQPAVAQDGTPAPVPSTPPPAVQQIPPPVQPEKAAPAQNANSASSAAVPNAKAPKLVVSETKLDFGKQQQGKTLNRAIAIRNVGRSDLNIESVAPS